jgi:outer membrane protein assembly factor BamB
LKRTTLLLPIVAAMIAACGSASASPSASTAPTGAGRTTEPTATAVPTPTPTPRSVPEVAWTFKTAGAIWGSAAIRDGVVYIGSNDKNLYAVDAKTGAQKWKFTTAGEVRSTAAFSEGNVIFSSDDGNLYSVAASTGKETWHIDIHNKLTRLPLNDPAINSTFDFDFLTSSPVVSGGLVYVGSSNGDVQAIDVKTGSIEWLFKTGDRVRATPAVAGGIVYIGSWDGYMYALKADTGELVWKYFAGDDVLTPKYLVQPIQSNAYVAGGFVYGASRKTISFKLDAKTGKEIWQLSNGSGNWFESSPVIRNGVFYIGSSAQGNLNAIDAELGYPLTSFVIGTAAWSRPTLDGDTVFIGAENFGAAAQAQAGVYAVKLGDDGAPGEARWHFTTTGPTLEPAGVGGVNSSPLFADHVLYFGGMDGQLYALNV